MTPNPNPPPGPPPPPNPPPQPPVATAVPGFDEMRKILEKILEVLQRPAAPASPAVSIDDPDQDLKVKDRHPFLGGARKSLHAVGFHKTANALSRGQSFAEGLDEMREALFGSKKPKIPRGFSTKWQAGGFPQVHKAPPTAWNANLPVATATPAPTAWPAPSAAIPAPTAPTNPGQGWTWQPPRSPTGPLPGPTAANSWANASTAPSVSPQTPNLAGPTPWTGPSTSSLQPLSGGSGASAALNELVATLERTNGLLERIAGRLDTVASDDDDEDATQGLEHEHTRQTSGPLGLARLAGGSSGQEASTEDSKPETREPPGGPVGALQNWFKNIVGGSVLGGIK